MHNDCRSGVNTAFLAEWSVVVHRESRRIVHMTPAEGFVLPAQLVIADEHGTHDIDITQCEVHSYSRDLAAGCMPQTSFLFRLDSGQIVEAEPDDLQPARDMRAQLNGSV